MIKHVKANLKAVTLDTYLENMMLEQSGNEIKFEQALLMNTELIHAKTQSVAESSQRFLESEQTYARLTKAKQLQT